MKVVRDLLLAVAAVSVCGCAASSPRYTQESGEPGSAGPVPQQDDLAGELLVPPPQRRAEDLVRARPDAVLPMAGAATAPVVAEPVVLPPAPDTSRAFQPPPPTGPRKEYQVQVAITPSAEEAEEFKERLVPLLPGEEVFVVFTRPYYRIRVGRKQHRQEAEDLLARLAQLGYENTMVIPVTITPPPLGEGAGPGSVS